MDLSKLEGVEDYKDRGVYLLFRDFDAAPNDLLITKEDALKLSIQIRQILEG